MPAGVAAPAQDQHASAKSTRHWLSLTTFTIYLGWGIVTPVLPKYAESFGVGSFAVGVLVASLLYHQLCI